jgi:glutamine amidotransferase
MCELLGISANKKIHINDLLETFYSHSVEHMNGWGLAFFDDSDVRLVKEAVRAIDSENLKKILS